MKSKKPTPKAQSTRESTKVPKKFSDLEIKEFEERADKVAQQFLDSLNRSTGKVSEKDTSLKKGSDTKHKVG